MSCYATDSNDGQIFREYSDTLKIYLVNRQSEFKNYSAFNQL